MSKSWMITASEDWKGAVTGTVSVISRKQTYYNVMPLLLFKSDKYQINVQLSFRMIPHVPRMDCVFATLSIENASAQCMYSSKVKYLKTFPPHNIAPIRYTTSLPFTANFARLEYIPRRSYRMIVQVFCSLSTVDKIATYRVCTFASTFAAVALQRRPPLRVSPSASVQVASIPHYPPPTTSTPLRILVSSSRTPPSPDLVKLESRGASSPRSANSFMAGDCPCFKGSSDCIPASITNMIEKQQATTLLQRSYSAQDVPTRPLPVLRTRSLKRKRSHESDCHYRPTKRRKTATPEITRPLKASLTWDSAVSYVLDMNLNKWLPIPSIVNKVFERGLRHPDHSPSEYRDVSKSLTKLAQDDHLYERKMASDGIMTRVYFRRTNRVVTLE